MYKIWFEEGLKHEPEWFLQGTDNFIVTNNEEEAQIKVFTNGKASKDCYNIRISDKPRKEDQGCLVYNHKSEIDAKFCLNVFRG